MMSLGWYARRLSRMSLPEVATRGREHALKLLWRVRPPNGVGEVEVARRLAPPVALPPGIAREVHPEARERVRLCAERLLEGHWRTFAIDREDVGEEPDWFADPRTGRRAPAARYAFSIDHRAESEVGNVKYVWELSRHHQVTLLATAYLLTADERFARRAAAHLTSWWRGNPFLSGVHWTSGIEVGMRLIAWVWARRLLDGWSEAPALFERNATFVRQLAAHQEYLVALPSHHSSANNHLIAEAAGLFVAACAFRGLPKSEDRRERAAAVLRRELERQTFACGVNRELATDYHGYVLELALAAALEGEASGHPLSNATWECLHRMTDALAAVVDVRCRPPRQGDSDDATALLLDAPDYDRWSALLDTGEVLFGRRDWWPVRPPGMRDVRTALWTSLAPGRRRPSVRPNGTRTSTSERPSHFPAAGIVILRDVEPRRDEIWCRCDHGPHGLPPLAAHGHADALSIELRCGGVDVLADPGTFCYHGDRAWRRYFRSTLAHNTLELAGRSQSVDAGPFLWGRTATASLCELTGLDSGTRARWVAEHDGYVTLSPAATHRREVELDRERRSLAITDTVHSEREHDARLAFHLGDAVVCALDGSLAMLEWTDPSGEAKRADLHLPAELHWRVARGETNPPLGWYSRGFDQKCATSVLVGSGRMGLGRPVRSLWQLHT
jgi:hypothetical protein